MSSDEALSPREQSLLIQVSDLVARNAALERKITHLEQRLEQRYKTTLQAYDPGKFDTMRSMAYRIFLDAAPSAFLSMQEAVQLFHETYPNVNFSNVDRRIMELAQENGKYGHKLGRKQDSDGTVRYFLWLGESDGMKLQVREPMSPMLSQ